MINKTKIVRVYRGQRRNIFIPRKSFFKTLRRHYVIEDLISNSTSGGEMAISIEYAAESNSTSSGIMALDLARDYISNSLSGGTLDIEIIAALADIACYVLNLDTGRTYQFDNSQFKGFGRFNGKFLGIKAGGIYDLETVAISDNGTAITAYFEIQTDFGVGNFKGLRNIYLDEDAATVTITKEDGTTVINNINPNEFRGLPRTLRDKSFTIKIQNIAGEQNTIRRIQGEVDILGRKGE